MTEVSQHFEHSGKAIATLTVQEILEEQIAKRLV